MEKPLIPNRAKYLFSKERWIAGMFVSVMLFLEILLGRNAFESYYVNLILQGKHIQSCGHH